MIVISKTIPTEILENVFVTALEGGSNYWYYMPDESVAKIRKAVPRNTNPFISLAIVKAILEHGVEVGINDAENEEEEIGVISLKTLPERLQKLADEQPDAFNAEMQEEGDAETSDTWMQYMTLGEIVYG